MSWTGWPISTSGVGLDYDVLIQPWIEIRKRQQALGGNSPYCCNLWPRRGQDYFDSTVSSLTATTVTVAAGAFGTDHDLAASLGGGATLPSTFDLIIDDCDPRKVVRAQISDNVGAVLTVSDMTDYVTGKWISALSSLVGKTCFIIRRGWPWYHDRWLDFPNDHCDYNGSGASGGVEGSGTYSGDSYLEDATATWPDDILAGKYLSVYAGGILRRVAIAGNSATRIYFSSVAWTAGGAYSVHGSTTRCWPGKIGCEAWKWYSGVTDTYQGVATDGTISGTSLAAATVDVYHGSPGFCTTDAVTAKDTDVWNAADDGCAPDQYYSWDFWKTWRSIQCWIEQNCTSFVEDKNWTGEDSIPNFTPAEFFALVIPTNSGTSTVAGTDPNYYFNITRPFEGAQVWWTILNSNGEELATGFDTIDATNKVILPDIATEDIGKSVVWSLGWTRKFHRRFRRLFPQTVFIPDLNGTTAIDPPTCPTYPGTWTRRTASTTYAEADDDGFINDDGVAFVDGDYARFIGYNHNDGNIAGTIETTTYGEDLDYQRGFHISKREEIPQAAINAQLLGVATDGGTTWLKCANNWYDRKWISGTDMIEQTGTATGGSSTSLTTTGISTSCFFDAGRFTGLAVFENFILEWDHSAVTYKARITSVSGNTINFASIGTTPQSGDTWRIKEPYEINRYEGRTLTITEDDGTTTHSTTILANDNDTLFFTSIGTAVLTGWSFQIDDPPVSSMFHRVSGAWVATGEDTEPTHATKKGKARKLDIVSRQLLNEIYDAISALTAFAVRAWEWTADGTDDATSNPDENQWIGGANSNDFVWLDTWADAKTQSETEWTSTTPTIPGQTRYAGASTAEGIAPNASYGGEFERGDDGMSGFDQFRAGITRTYAYAYISGLATCLDHEIDWYAYAGITDSDTPAAASGDHQYIFNANGDDDGGTFQYRKFVKWGSNAADNSSTAVSPACGNTDPSTLPTAPASPPTDTTIGYVGSIFEGYAIVDMIAVIRPDLT